MNTLLEPSNENIDRMVTRPGTTYFYVSEREVQRIRGRIYAAMNRQGQGEVQTSYDRGKHVLRVVVSW